MKSIYPLAIINVLGNVLTNVSLGHVAVSFTHTVKVRDGGGGRGRGAGRAVCVGARMWMLRGRVHGRCRGREGEGWRGAARGSV